MTKNISAQASEALDKNGRRLRIGLVTVSDRASRGEYEDRGGPAMLDWMQKAMLTPFEAVTRVIADEGALIEKTLCELVDEHECALVITTGGTGPSRRDVTVEATLAVCDKTMPGFGELMRKVSLEKVPTAILSRQEAGIRYAMHKDENQKEIESGALIINLPGSPKAIAECLSAVFPAVPYCIELMGGPYLETNEEVSCTFRPQKK